MKIIQECIGFFQFISTAYGTGNLAADAMTVGICICGAVFILGLLRLTALRGGKADIEIERLDFIIELLNELNLQMIESRNLMSNELHRCKGELGAARQDFEDILETWNRRQPTNRVASRDSTSLHAAFGQTRLM